MSNCGSLFNSLSGLNLLNNLLLVNGDITLTQPFDCIEVDGSAGDVTVTLPAVSNNFITFGKMSVIRIDDPANVNNIVKIVAATPSDLDETDNEIILDIVMGVDIYASKTDSKWRSTNSFSEKRIQDLLVRSTGSNVPGYTNQANYLSINTTAEAHETLDINQSGTGWIYDRTIEKFVSRPFKVKWDSADTQALDTTPPNDDGTAIVMIDKDGTIIVEDVNDAVLLRSFNNGGRNSNTELQIGAFVRSGGVISNILAGGGEKVNLGIRIDDLLDNLGVINSSFNPSSISFNGANLNLDLLPGEGSVRATGFVNTAAGLAPDVQRLTTTVTQVTIFFVTRDNVIQSITTPGTMNVTQFEDPNNPGTLITLQNDTKAKVNFYKSFLSGEFLTEIVGQVEYNSIALAIIANETPDFPSLVEFGIPIQRVFILRNETDPGSNATILPSERIDLMA